MLRVSNLAMFVSLWAVWYLSSL